MHEISEKWGHQPNRIDYPTIFRRMFLLEHPQVRRQVARVRVEPEIDVRRVGLFDPGLFPRVVKVIDPPIADRGSYVRRISISSCL